MFWRRRKEDAAAAALRARIIASTPNRGELLRHARNHRERALMCARWAEEARQDWYQGQRECILDVLASKSYRYRDFGPKARELIGRQQWINSREQKVLAADEQMFSRWADHYGKMADVEERSRSGGTGLYG